MTFKRKRSHTEFQKDEHVGAGTNADFAVGQTLEYLRAGAAEGQEHETEALARNSSDSATGEWQTVTSKRRRKESRGRQERGTSPNAGNSQGKTPKTQNNYLSISHSANSRLQAPLKLADLQNLIFYLLASGTSPQWVSVRNHDAVKRAVVLMVPGLDRELFRKLSATQDGLDLTISIQESTYQNTKHSTPDSNKYDSKPVTPDDWYPVPLLENDLPEPLKPLAAIFEHLWPVKTPGDDRLSKVHSPLAAMLTSPIPKNQDKRRFGSGPAPPREGKDWQDQPTPVTHFLATFEELQANEFVVHSSLAETGEQARAVAKQRQVANQTKADGWVDVESKTPAKQPLSGKRSHIDFTAGQRVYAIDCEMCRTTSQQLELTRVTVIDWNSTVVLDELVKPTNAITDYLTAFSGITREKLESVTTTLADVQVKLLKLFAAGSILVGHSLNSDLAALKLTHPCLVDTSILYPHPRGWPLKSSLKWLAQKYLGREVQNGANGHDSIEDARTALDLVKLKCKRGPLWGTSDASSESIFKRLARSWQPKKSSRKTCLSSVVDWGYPKLGYGAEANFHKGCDSDQKVAAETQRAVTGDEDGKVIPGGGVDFIWARMRELEAVRGWWVTSNPTESEPFRKKALQDHQVPVPSDNAQATSKEIAWVLAQTVQYIKAIYETLPPATAFMVYSGGGDPRELNRLQKLQAKFKKEFSYKKWDELSVHWADPEEQAMKAACRMARDGLAFVTIK